MISIYVYLYTFGFGCKMNDEKKILNCADDKYQQPSAEIGAALWINDILLVYFEICLAILLSGI